VADGSLGGARRRAPADQGRYHGREGSLNRPRRSALVYNVPPTILMSERPVFVMFVERLKCSTKSIFKIFRIFKSSINSAFDTIDLQRR
jgi:hypothetical protein